MLFYERRTVTVVLAACVWALLISCSGSESSSVSKISTSGRIIQVDELLDTPFKELREYGTDGLPGATTVIHGFLRDGSNAYDYEVRFYESHDEAIEFGTAMAEEGSGPNAVIRESDATYKEGIKDRRMVIGGLEGAIEGGTVGPKYGGYVIFENLILLCQGSEFEHSLERCGLLTSALQPPD